MKRFLTILLTLAIAVPATWFAATRLPSKQAAPKAAGTNAAAGERKLLYYQSAMHPWIKSDKPGRCTICGMQLTPVYEGDPGFENGGDVVALSKTMIQVLNVETAPIEMRSLDRILTVAGTIEENNARHRILSAYIGGRIEKLYVNFVGAEVKEGQPLAEFYSPALLQSEREYRTLTGDLRDATRVRLRQMGLTAAQIEALPENSADTLTSQILAPIGGTVVAQNVYEGQYVQEGERIFEIADFSMMWFQFHAYEQDLPWIKIGLAVDVTTPSVPGKTFQGKIKFIDPNFDEVTRSTKVRVELNNPVVDGRRLLLHRLYADGAVHVETAKALAIPRSAIIQTGPQALVYIDEGNGHYARRNIKIGRRGDEFVEALSGISAAEKVVINGNLLIDGQAEMNRSFTDATHEETTSKASAAPLNEAQKIALADFIKANEAAAHALGTDDLAEFNKAGENVMTSTDALTAAFKDREELKDILSHVAEARHLHAAADLAAARKTFHPFANASAKTLELLQNTEGASGFQVFECPMVDKAIPGMPNRGRWVQGATDPLLNPYFGKAMSDCGKRVIP